MPPEPTSPVLYLYRYCDTFQEWPRGSLPETSVRSRARGLCWGQPALYSSSILVPGHKYPKIEGDHLYGGTDTHGCFAIYFFNPCFRVLMAWDKYYRYLSTVLHL